MSRFTKDVAVFPFPTNTDLSAKRGYAAKLASGFAVLNDSATAAAAGVILDGEAAGGQASLAMFGGNVGTCKFKLGAAVSAIGAGGTRLQQRADGSFGPDAGTGARVVVAITYETGAVDELIEAVPIAPVVFAS